MQKAQAYEMPGQVQVSVQRTTAPQVLRWWAPTCTPPAYPIPNAIAPSAQKARIHSLAVSGGLLPLLSCHALQ